MQPSLENALFRAEQVRAFDAYAVDELGIPGYTLMQRAAGGAWGALRARWRNARRIHLLCGPGNNGGDAWALGALALEQGYEVRATALGTDPAGDAGKAFKAYRDAGGQFDAWRDSATLPEADIYVDGLFGTGLSRAIDEPAAALVRAVNAADTPVLALDVPSGLSADTGVCLGDTVRADLTVTFVALKRGLFTHEAADHCGARQLDRLGLPDTAYSGQAADAYLLAPDPLPRRPRASHKGENGHVLAIGGDAGAGGAIRMCAEAALRTGAGLVSVATREAHISALNAGRPELMAHAVETLEALQPLLQRSDVLALGPGLGQDAWGRGLWQAALDAGQPLVIDADALNLLAKTPRRLHTQAVLTPHPGEAARLLDSDVPTIQNDRFAAARSLAERFGAVAVLKGCGSLVAHPDGRVAVCTHGNPGMASGGMGDVLTGVIAALLAQGLDAWHAACRGTDLHAHAGDTAARRGERGLIASDLIETLRALNNGPVHA